MFWTARIVVVLIKTMQEYSRGNLTPEQLENVFWWLMVGQSEEEYA